MIDQKQKDEYVEMHFAFQQGFISQQEWMEYCSARLAAIMLENVDVFKRLKDR